MYHSTGLVRLPFLLTYAEDIAEDSRPEAGIAAASLVGVLHRLAEVVVGTAGKLHLIVSTLVSYILDYFVAAGDTHVSSLLLWWASVVSLVRHCSVCVI